MPLIYKDREHGWLRYVWLIFLSFFLVHPLLDHISARERLLSLLGTIFFLVCYFGIFSCKGKWPYLCLAGIGLLGVIFAPFNPGASVFFIYVASFMGFVVEKPRTGFILLGALLAAVGLESWLLHLRAEFWVTSFVVSIGVGVANIHFAERNRANAKLRLAHSEIEHLAKVAERERIARDLHDVLGHTLSVIILKSELAGKLIDRDGERARAEIADVEKTAREALAEVRHTIRGYRAQSLEAELKRARAALETAGLSVQSEAADVTLTPVQESVVALVVREAVTNVVRHAKARNFLLRLAPVNGNCLLEIQDDGRGGDQVEGNGLLGMRERIEALGGTVQRDTRAGTRLTIQFPLTAAKEHEAKE
jgi:two-component system sensor histidine kinase DesK